MANIADLLALGRESMNEVIESFKTELSKLRLGGANVEMVKNISVEVYGNYMPMYQVATISSPSANSIIITPWDKANLRAIGAGIDDEFKKEVNPNIRDDAVYLNFPPLTQEKKEEFVKLIKEKSENYRQRMRDARQDIKTELEQMKKDAEVSEDLIFKALEELDEITRQYTEQINELYETKKVQLLK